MGNKTSSQVAGRGISRRSLIRNAAVGAGSAALVPALTAGRVFAASDPVPALPLKPFEFDEATVGDLQRRMASGEISSRSLTEAYLERIDEIDDAKKHPGLNAVIEVNPDAAGDCDGTRQRAQSERQRAGRCTAFRC